MSQRFFLDAISGSKPLAAGDKVTLEGDQAHHAINVMRFNTGDKLVLFDGTGIEYLASVDQVQKKSISLEIIESIESSRSLSTSITIAVALPKGDRQKFLIEKLVELGVHTLIPLKTKRAVAVANPKVVSRLEKQVIEASKQCGRNTLMQIDQPLTINQLIQNAGGGVKLLADPYQGKPISNFTAEAADGFVIAIGPEGGFDDSEIELLISNDFKPVTIGPSILRIETACIAVAAILGIGQE